MRNMRFYLPAVQVTLAGVLMSVSPLRGEDPWSAWRSIERQICFGVNAPATIIANLLAKCEIDISPQIDNLEHLFITYVLYLIIIAALWYAVAFEISRLGSKGSSLTILTRYRVVADSTLIASGLILLFMGAMSVVFDMGWARWYEKVFGAGCLSWGIVLTFFYARDIFLYVKARLALRK